MQISATHKPQSPACRRNLRGFICLVVASHMCWGLTNTSFPSGDRLKKRLQGAALFSEHLFSALRSV